MAKDWQVVKQAPELLVRGKSDRKAVVAGEMFAFTFVDPPEVTLVGRVVRDDATTFGLRERYPLIYVYRDVFDSDPTDEVLLAGLTPDHLLIPPQLTTKHGWTQGAFRRLGRFPLTPRVVLDRHVFLHGPTRHLYDEYATRVEEPQTEQFQGRAVLGGWNAVALKAFRALGLQTSDGMTADDFAKIVVRP